MRQILCILVCVGALFGAQPYKILGLVPFGDWNLKIVFDRDISALKLDEKKLQDGRVFVDIESILIVPKKSFAFKDNSIINVAQNTPQIVRIVIKPTKTYRLHKDAHNLYVRLGGSTPPKPQTPATTESSTLAPTPNLSTKKKIVIDPGHGGKDCGAMGVAKVCEKQIVLEVAKYLQAELKKRGYITYMTRERDTFIDLIERTKFANDKGADLFVSIHANSIPVGRKSPSGIETYFLSTNRSQKALKVAEAENIGDIATMNYFSKQTFLHTINNHRLIASSKLAVDIQAGMVDSVRRKHKNIIDVGACVGDSSLVFGDFTTKSIYAFEPTSANYNHLLRTIALNNATRIIPVKKALGSKPDRMKISVNGGSSSLVFDNHTSFDDVEVITLDSFVREHDIEVGFIKVDIEGFEQEFLKGARETIATQKPAMLLSIYHNAEDFLSIKPMIESWNLGYRFKVIKPIDFSVMTETALYCEVPS